MLKCERDIKKKIILKINIKQASVFERVKFEVPFTDAASVNQHTNNLILILLKVNAQLAQLSVLLQIYALFMKSKHKQIFRIQLLFFVNPA